MTTADVTVVTARPTIEAARPIAMRLIPSGLRVRVPRLLALASVLAVVTCTALFVVLHLLPVSGALNPARTPLSDYALTPAGPLFDIGVGALIVAVMCLLAALIVAGELSAPSWPALITVVCCAALTVVVLIPNRTLPDGALTTAAEWHWVAAMIAFAGLPITPLLLARRHRARTGCSRLPRLAGWLSRSAAVWFAALFLGSICEFTGEGFGWRIGGAVERALTGSEVCAVLLLALWVWHGCRCRTVQPGTADAIGTPGR